ncbi:MAG: hypothetical protein QOI63_443 [Thermoplasmata archaeon]|jgi:hypothetical protein|nr:hypothetical protein [Thermoplasmata archaeon]
MALFRPVAALLLLGLAALAPPLADASPPCMPSNPSQTAKVACAAYNTWWNAPRTIGPLGACATGQPPTDWPACATDFEANVANPLLDAAVAAALCPLGSPVESCYLP